MFFEHPDGTTRLASIDANLPKLLFGHNGRLIQSQEFLVLALSRLRWIAAHFVSAHDQYAILPGPDNSGHVVRMEIALQLWDYRKGMLLGSHLTNCRGFRKPPLIAADESTTHRSEELDICFYDKHRQLRQGRLLPSYIPCTRIETRFRSNKRLIKAAGVKAPRRFDKVATFSFAWLFSVFSRTISASLTGALARATPRPPRNLRPDSVRITDLEDPILVHTALAEHKHKAGRREGGRIKREVFDEFSRRYNWSLEAILARGYPRHIVSEIEIPDVEMAHRLLGRCWGWPGRPYEDVSSAFRKTTYLDVRAEPEHHVLRG
jgi:hypothetical protein